MHMFPVVASLANVSFADILDILIIAVGLYSVFLLFQKTKTYLILFGSTIFVTLYLAARYFNLVLTLQIMQYFAGVSIVVFSIIFQREIRQYFELLGLFGTRQIPHAPLLARSPATAEIIQSCIKMAKTRTGALLVLKGRDSLVHLLEGGVEVDGLISEELILSIFDPHSDGHDGALVIQNNRLAFLGTHLPLSNNFKEIGRHGTRHAAGLGLSENCDALSIVISEEKGSITLYKNGRAKTLEEYDDLEKELNRFIKETYQEASSKTFFQSILSNWGLKVGALSLSTLLWFFIVYRGGIVQKTFLVSVAFTLPPNDLLVQSYQPKSVEVTLSGRSESSFANVASDSIKLNIQSNNLHDGVNQINLGPSLFKVPKNLELSGLNPSSILLTANRYQLHTLPLAVKTKGVLLPGYTIKKTIITPETIDVLIPGGEKIPKEIFLDTIDISGQKESLVVARQPLLPVNLKQKDNPSISVALTIEK